MSRNNPSHARVIPINMLSRGFVGVITWCCWCYHVVLLVLSRGNVGVITWCCYYHVVLLVFSSGNVGVVASKLYGVNATIIIFVFVLYYIGVIMWCCWCYHVVLLLSECCHVVLVLLNIAVGTVYHVITWFVVRIKK